MNNYDDKEITDKYVTIDILRDMLEISDGLRNYQVYNRFTPFIRTITIDKHTKKYNLEDIQKLIEGAKNFFDKCYLKASDINLESNAFNVKKIYIPEQYRTILLKSIKRSPSNCFVYKKVEKTDYIYKDNYIDVKTVRDILGISNSKRNFEICKLLEPFVHIIRHQKSNSILYNKNDVQNFLEDAKKFFDEHYIYSDIINSLPNKSFINDKEIKSFRLPSHYHLVLHKITNKKMTNVSIFKKSEIDIAIKEYHEFLVEREEKLKQKREKSKQIAREKQRKRYCINKDKKTLKRKIINDCEYVSTDLACSILSFTNSKYLLELRKHNAIDFLTINSIVYYKLSDIENIIYLRNNFLKTFTVKGLLEKEYFSKYQIPIRYSTDLPRYTFPPYCIGLGNSLGAGISTEFNKGAFKISDIDKFIEDWKKSKSKSKLTNINRSTLFETFESRLNAHPDWSGFNKNSEYTSEKTMLFIKNILSNSNRTTRIGQNDILCRYIHLPILIVDILNKNNVSEIYLLTDAKINFYMNTIKNKSAKKIFYRFLKEVNVDLRKVGVASKLKFNFQNITNPNIDMQTESEDDDKKNIYDFLMYADVFNYLTNIDTHIPIIVNEFKEYGTRVHASIWLYTMLHLNNAWRNGDCDRFPELQVKDLIEEYRINNIEWFLSNKLTLAQSKGVIFRVRQWEMRMSKTQIKGVFFCSDELAPAFATAIIILTLIKYTNNVILDENYNDKSILMCFDNTNNNASSTHLKNFFAPAEIKGFKFSSRKFNRTIMSYIYLLANLREDSKALVYCQEIRRHLNIENTVLYVDFDIKKIEALASQLFTRGEFGYIPALLSQKVLGTNEVESFEDITNQVIKINNAFGNVSNINNTLSFLNTIKSDRQQVIDMISNKSFEECQEIYTDLFTNSAVCGDDSNIQCLFSKQGCKNVNVLDDKDSSCFDCPYHIPSIYALTRLCEELIRDFKYYLGLPKEIKTRDIKEYLIKNPPKRLKKQNMLKIGLRIERRKVILLEAIKKFSREYVYRCINIEREDFKFISDFIKLDFYTSFPELNNKN